MDGNNTEWLLALKEYEFAAGYCVEWYDDPSKYAKGNFFEVKQRLYQVEEKVEYLSFVRASKSLLVNLKKIISISPDTGGRGKIKLTNNETVIASRSYIKNVTERLMDLAK